MNSANKQVPLNLLILIMLYVTCKITCDPMFFRQIDIPIPFTHNIMKISSSVLLYPLTYVICDAIVAICNRSTIVAVVLIATFCDGIFSLLIHVVTNLAMPTVLSQTQLNYANAVNLLAPKMWALYYHGIIGSLTAIFGEIYLFSVLFRRIKSFLLSTLISVSTLLMVHNVLTDYPVLRGDADAWHIVANNIMFNISFLFIYLTLIYLVAKLNLKQTFNYLPITPIIKIYNYFYQQLEKNRAKKWL